MTRIAKEVGVLAILVLLLVPTVAAEKTKDSPAPSQSMTLWQARRTVVAGFSPLLSSCRFTLDGLECDGSGEHFRVDLKNLPPVFVKFAWGPKCVLKDEKGKTLPAPLSTWSASCPRARGGLAGSLGPQDVVYAGANYDVAKSLAAALNSLREFANDAESPLRTFPQRAETWRALASKPPIPEEVRTQRLLAENAVQEKKPEEALVHYETGLELYPTWPQGYFNAALIAAELGYHAEAVEHMKAYLELVPDAPDAQSARDQIVIWQYKAKNPVPAAKA